MAIRDLATLHRDAGMKVTEIRADSRQKGWRNNGRPGSFAPEGCCQHHTAGHKDLHVVVYGRSDLPGPLSNRYFPKAGGIVIVSAGRTNHAGNGARKVLDELRRDIAPSGSAAARKLVDEVNGNGLFWSAECENLGDGKDPWPDEQRNAMALSDALICRAEGWSANRVIGHLEWSKRKIDPRGFTMDEHRQKVAWLLNQSGPVPTPAPTRGSIYMPPIHLASDIASDLWLDHPDGTKNAIHVQATVTGDLYWWHMPGHSDTTPSPPGPAGQSYWKNRQVSRVAPSKEPGHRVAVFATDGAGPYDFK